jgi:hypothetical protein
MRDAVVLVVLYAGFLGLFRLLGGLGAAAETFERWGRASATLRPRAGSSG